MVEKVGRIWHGTVEGWPEIDERGLTENVARRKAGTLATRLVGEEVVEMAETGFEILEVTEWSYVTPKVFMGNRNMPAQVKDRPAGMLVRCKACGYKWTAKRWPSGLKPGTFWVMPFGVQITCGNPKCEQDETVGNAEIPQ